MVGYEGVTSSANMLSGSGARVYPDIGFGIIERCSRKSFLTVISWASFDFDS